MTVGVSTRPTGARARVLRHAGIVLGALLVMSAGVAVGAARATSASNARVRGVVLFAGDSNVTLGAQAIDWTTTWKSHTDNGYVPVLASRVGSTIRTSDCLVATGCTTTNYWKVKLAAVLQRVHPDAVVTNLGINDTVKPGTATTAGYASYGAKIDWFMSLMPHGVPVLWSTLPCTIEPATRSTGCKAVNTALARAKARWPELIVVDWAGAADAHPSWLGARGAADSIHLDTAGEEAWATLMVRALDAHLHPVT